MLKHIAIYAVTALTFAAAGYGYEHRNSEYLLSFPDRGYCAAKDVAGTRYWYACQDAFIAAELQQHDAETSAILADMASKSAKKAGGRK